jgi:hypothetical protein
MMSEGDKICVLCGKSCAGETRIKNEKGRYAHQACVQAKQQQKKQVDQERLESDSLYEDDYADALGGGLDDLFEDADPTLTKSCEMCGKPMAEEAVVCMTCGFNLTLGKQVQTKASKERVQRESKVYSTSTAVAGSIMSQLLIPILCGCIGGGIGAGIWAGVAYYGQIRLSILGWGVGALVGFGVNIGSRDTGGVVYGMIAVIIALGSVVGGNYITSSLLVNQYLEMLEPDDISDDMAMGKVIVWEVLDDWLEQGEEIVWPKEWKTWDLAEWPEDFPRLMVTKTINRWDEMSYEDQESVRVSIAEVTRANSQMIEHEMIESGFWYLMKQPRNVIFLVLASISAFLLASKE